MALNDSNADIRVVVGVTGGTSIADGSGQLIADTLKTIANNISSDTSKIPKVTFTIDPTTTANLITSELNRIAGQIKVDPIDLNIRTNQSSIGSFAEDEYRKLIDETKGRKSKANLIAHIEEKQGIAEVIVQKKRDEEATRKQIKAAKDHEKQIRSLSAALESANQNVFNQKFNSIHNIATKTGNAEALSDLQKLKETHKDVADEIKRLQVEFETENTKDLSGKIIGDSGNYDFNGLIDNIQKVEEATNSLYAKTKVKSPLFIEGERLTKQARDVSEFSLSLQKFAKANDKFKNNSGLAAEFGRINVELAELKSRSDLGEDIGFELDQLKTKTNNWKSSIESAGLSGQTTLGKLRAQMEKLGVYMSASAILMGAWKQVKQMTTNVIELDTAMTELKKVTDETDASYSKFLDNAEARAKSIGASLTDTITATADFARLGYSLSEAEQISDAALVYKNVGDGIRDVNAASESVISTMKAFGVEASNSMSIVDRFNEVGRFAHAA